MFPLSGSGSFTHVFRRAVGVVQMKAEWCSPPSHVRARAVSGWCGPEE